jgi:hypothetical protein
MFKLEKTTNGRHETSSDFQQALGVMLRKNGGLDSVQIWMRHVEKAREDLLVGGLIAVAYDANLGGRSRRDAIIEKLKVGINRRMSS